MIRSLFCVLIISVGLVVLCLFGDVQTIALRLRSTMPSNLFSSTYSGDTYFIIFPLSSPLLLFFDLGAHGGIISRFLYVCRKVRHLEDLANLDHITVGGRTAPRPLNGFF